jgi:probable F420-dependent oxidoreductase
MLMIQLALYSSIANPPHGEDLDRCVDETSAEAQLAESCGFDAIFFGEHHQDHDGFLPSPLIVATAMAARTTRLKVGTSVILLPLFHPIHVAEDVATLDIVSHGRAILGVGLGYQPADFAMFGVPQAERVGRFEEGLEIIRRCWRGERFSFAGTYYQIDQVQMLPRPLQQPAPPLWIGAGGPAAVRRAGRLGDAWVASSSMPLEAMQSLTDQYREAALAAGREPCVILIRDAWVAASREEAERVYGPEVMAAYKYYWRHQSPAFQDITSERAFTLENLARDRLILGTPEECVQQLHRWQQALGTDYVIFRLRHAHSGGPPHAEIMRAIELFGSRVIPQL